MCLVERALDSGLVSFKAFFLHTCIIAIEMGDTRTLHIQASIFKKRDTDFPYIALPCDKSRF